MMKTPAKVSGRWTIRNVRSRFVRRSFAVTLLFVAGFMLFLPWFSLHLSLRSVIADTESVMNDFVSRDLSFDVQRMIDDPELREDLADKIDVLMHFSSMVDFRIWTDDARIAFAFRSPEQVGRQYPDKEELFTALDEGVAHGEVIRGETHAENESLKGHGTLVEMFVPVQVNGVAVGAVEVYRIAPELDYFGVNALFAAGVAVILPILLYLLLYGEFTSATRTITRYGKNLTSAYVELGHSYFNSIRSLSGALEMRDLETEGHSERVVSLALSLGVRMKLSDRELGQLVIGSYLHDIGKIGIPDSILLKPGALDEDERTEMMGHVLAGARLVERVDFLKQASDVILAHHERWDGAGYPMGLAGTDIPKIARIFALVDVCDALLSDRPYKEAYSFKKALAIIKDGRGTHFDPEVVDCFIEMGEDEIRRVFKEADDGSALPKVRRAVGALLDIEFAEHVAFTEVDRA